MSRQSVFTVMLESTKIASVTHGFVKSANVTSECVLTLGYETAIRALINSVSRPLNDFQWRRPEGNIL